jgi:hypothetical protein
VRPCQRAPLVPVPGYSAVSCLRIGCAAEDTSRFSTTRDSGTFLQMALQGAQNPSLKLRVLPQRWSGVQGTLAGHRSVSGQLHNTKPQW